MTSENRTRNLILAAVGILLFVGSVVFATIQLRRNGQLEESLKGERLTAESLLSEKLSLEKDMVRINEELTALQGRNSLQQAQLAEIAQKLADAESQLQKVKHLGTGLEQLKKQNQELADLKATTELQLEGYRNTIAQLNAEKGELENALASAQQQNKALLAAIHALNLSHLDDILVASARKNNTLTIKAGRTRKISVQADVAAEADALSFRITDPGGKSLTEAHGSFTINTLSTGKQRPQAFYVAGNDYTAPVYKTIQATYTSTAKLASGTYTMELLNGDHAIGTLQVKLK